MKIKIIEATHELDLEDALNQFLATVNVIKLHYQVAICSGDELEYSFSCMIEYDE